jgi:hypothetical protein
MAQQTPKEKAEELIMKMSFETHAYNAKSCALIAVNEIIPIVNSYENALSASQQSDYLEYLYEVKQEIEKL